ncbi:DASH complex subunit Hsk3 like-domain-containing protein [Scheffersomyces coipomensis]|uniref:DASH complex subunit Hsk3 like-domain-containing protein n=1 Tax=Scheffersomyces coipomensis TaxID=1788519 RepID=UPI00315CE74E
MGNVNKTIFKSDDSIVIPQVLYSDNIGSSSYNRIGYNGMSSSVSNSNHISSSIKQRQLSHLNSQIAQLHANLNDFNDLIQITCNQYQSIEKLGKIHAGLFMASHSVFENDNFNTNEEEPETQPQDDD